MSWQLAGRSMELCNCNMLCPCWLGPEGKPDQGWCGGAFGFDIDRGNSDGVDLGGTRTALAFNWPGNFFGGNGTARLYVNDKASPQQRQELEAIFSGRKGGLLAPLWSAIITKWLPVEIAQIDINWGETATLSVGKVGQAKLTALKDQAGHTTKVTGAAAQAAFQLESMDLASSKGSQWSDPDMRQWQGDSGTTHRFSWSA